MNRRKYIQRNLQRLRRIDGNTSQLFNGEGRDVAAGLGHEFRLLVKNTNASNTIRRVALLPGHYDTTTVKETKSSGTITGVSLIKADPAVLNAAGYSAYSVADDGVFGDVDCTALDPTNSIRSFLDYLRTNPMALKGIQINASSKSALNSSALVVTSSSPFQRNATKTINLSSYFSAFQNQDDMIQVDLTGNELELSDITMLFVDVPAGASLNIVLKF